MVVPVGKVSESSKRVMVEASKYLLQEVGQLPSAVEQFQLAIHYRRGLTDREISGLPVEWCAVAPVDDAGGGIVLERDT